VDHPPTHTRVFALMQSPPSHVCVCMDIHVPVFVFVGMSGVDSQLHRLLGWYVELGWRPCGLRVQGYFSSRGSFSTHNIHKVRRVVQLANACIPPHLLLPLPPLLLLLMLMLLLCGVVVGGCLSNRVNPVANKFLKRALQRMATLAGINASAAAQSIATIIASSSGDLRHAVHSFQFSMTGQHSTSAGHGSVYVDVPGDA